MAFASFDAYKAACANSQAYPTKNFSSRTQISSCWTATAIGGATPTTAAQCDDLTAGALISPIPATNKTLYLAAWFTATSASAVQPGGVAICDRLCHSGGLSGIVTTEQTTNLPSAALPRYMDAIGVMAALDVYSGLGTSATTATIRYTNSAGVANRTSKPLVIPASLGAGQRRVFALQDGDVGVQSVEGVTFAGSTGTAGNAGITLFKVLALPMTVTDFFGSGRESYDALYGGLPEVKPGACLEYMSFLLSSSNTFNGILRLLEA